MKRLLAALITLMPTAVPAVDLELRDIWKLSFPSSLAFDPQLCGLWIANESRELVLVNIFGEEFRRFETPLSMIKTVAPTEEFVIVSDNAGNFVRMSRQGDILEGPFEWNERLWDTEGVVSLPDGDILVVQDTPAHIIRVNPAGDVVSELKGMELSPRMTEPQGIALDPQSGHIFVTDDWEGSNSLFEFSADLDLLSVTPLIEYGVDPEGIAVHPNSGTMYIAFDQGRKVSVFNYTPAGDPLSPAIDVPDACGISIFSNEKSPV